MSFPRYPKYKDSGVDWLREVPEHWEVTRLKRAADVFPSNIDKKSYDGETPVRLCNYTDVYYNDTITQSIAFMPATASPDQIAKFTLRAGDTIITKDSETADDIAIAAYVPDDLPGVVCGYHLAIVRPRSEYFGAFIKRLFDSSYVKSRVAVLANGLTRVGLGQHELDNIELAFPPREEQGQIARFLDRETLKVDTLVAEQQRLIELLKEKRQAVISHAVTKGLRADARMKPSGHEWIGDIPEHWDVRRLKHVSPEITVGIVVEPSKYYADGGVPALRSLNVRPGEITVQNLVFISGEAHVQLSKSRLNAGDLVAVRSGQPGATAVVPPGLDGCNCIDLIIIRRPRGESEAFLSWFLNSDAATSQFTQGSGGAIQQHFNVGTAMDLVVCVPPLSEQLEIDRYLKRETGLIDLLVAECGRSIALLEEHSSSLISCAVTGKIDVRELPEDAEAA